MPNPDFDILAKAIMGILSEVKRPMKAREIATLLRIRDSIKVNRRGVNEVLYSVKYSQSFQRDHNFRWLVRPGATVKPQSPTEYGHEYDLGHRGQETSNEFAEERKPEGRATHKIPGVSRSEVADGEARFPSLREAKASDKAHRSDSTAWLRMQLARLKAGIPVDHSLLPSLTVGMDNLQERLSRLLDGGHSGRWMAVAGEFGNGKSHFLSLARHLACAKGWAVCSLVANGTDGSLAQPQRHLQFALDTTVSPQGAAVGIVELFAEWWDGSLRPQIVQWAGANAGILPLADDIISLEKKSLEFSAVTEYLGAKILGARAGNPLYRRKACNHLAQVIDLLMATGHQGLVLLIDEVESVFRLSTSRSWMASLRTLGNYCCDPLLANLAVVFVATPQAKQEIQLELPRTLQEIEFQVSTPKEEKLALRKFVEEMERFGWNECPELDGNQRIALGLCIIDLYVHATGRDDHVTPSPQMRAWLSRRDIPVRHAVRLLLTWLDSYT